MNRQSPPRQLLRRAFTDEQEQVVCRRYDDGETMQQLASAFGVSIHSVFSTLKRNGVQRRSTGEVLRKLSREQEEEVCQRYLAGETLKQLAAAFGPSSATIRQALIRGGVAMRTTAEAKRRFTDEQEGEICLRYSRGETSPQLASAFNVSPPSIRNVLKRNGVGRRDPFAMKKAEELDACRRYLNGESTPLLAESFGVWPGTIRTILIRNNVKPRSLAAAKGVLNEKEVAEVCRRYLDGESTVELSKAFNKQASTIRQVLKRNEVSRRSAKEAKGGLTLEAEAEVCSRYAGGESTYELASVFGVSDSTINKILRRHGIERRGPDGYGDSVQHALANTGHHTHARDCEFYVFELSRYSGTHCKPGISFNTKVRIRQADGEYGEEALQLVFATRQEAYFLEQAVLDATSGWTDCPAGLQDWPGATEVRALPASEMVAIALRLAEELEELGPWWFAARYVPMTIPQRSACQQRAIQQAQQSYEASRMGAAA